MALNISNASKYKGNIQALKDIAKKQEDLLPFTNLFDTLARSVAAVIAELQDSLKEKKANATGSLSQSILATPDEQTRDRVSININYNAYGNDADKGRKAEGFGSPGLLVPARGRRPRRSGGSGQRDGRSRGGEAIGDPPKIGHSADEQPCSNISI